MVAPLLLLVGDATQPRRPLQNQERLPEVVDRDSNRFRDVRLLPEISQLLAHPEKILLELFQPIHIRTELIEFFLVEEIAIIRF